MVEDACRLLPAEFREALDNVALTIQDNPPPGLDDAEGVLGYYQGIPLTERGTGYTMVLPDKITI
ncbi:MAG: hypothetical protein QOF51_1283, partial [Chloroflexota bacterium]|nr:hypothetical protein [Chloroflexota bacterium]